MYLQDFDGHADIIEARKEAQKEARKKKAADKAAETPEQRLAKVGGMARTLGADDSDTDSSLEEPPEDVDSAKGIELAHVYYGKAVEVKRTVIDLQAENEDLKQKLARAELSVPNNGRFAASKHRRNQRDDVDLYETSPSSVAAIKDILASFARGLNKQKLKILEPCCGLGAMANELKRMGHDVQERDKNFGEMCTDYLKHKEGDYFQYDIMVTNPPFSGKNDFLIKACLVGKPFLMLLPSTATFSSKVVHQCFTAFGLKVFMLRSNPQFRRTEESPSTGKQVLRKVGCGETMWVYFNGVKATSEVIELRFLAREAALDREFFKDCVSDSASVAAELTHLYEERSKERKMRQKVKRGSAAPAAANAMDVEEYPSPETSDDEENFNMENMANHVEGAADDGIESPLDEARSTSPVSQITSTSGKRNRDVIANQYEAQVANDVSSAQSVAFLYSSEWNRMLDSVKNSNAASHARFSAAAKTFPGHRDLMGIKNQYFTMQQLEGTLLHLLSREYVDDEVLSVEITQAMAAAKAVTSNLINPRPKATKPNGLTPNISPVA